MSDDTNRQKTAMKALWTAIEADDAEGVKKALVDGAKVDDQDALYRTPLHLAATDGHTEICKLLLENGAEVNAEEDEEGLTPLHWAAKQGHTHTCKLLLENGAEVNAKDKYGATPLHDAANYGNTETCELLRRYGAEM